MGKLVNALERAPRERDFECPRTGIKLRAVLPRRSVKHAATCHASDAWGERPIKRALDLDEYESLQREYVIAHCVFDGDSPIGLDAVRALDERTLRVYDRAVRQLEDGADPDVSTWTEETITELLDGLKKKDPRIEALLTSLEGASLLSFLRTMADRPSTAPTSRSS